MQRSINFFGLALLLTLGACGGGKNDTDTDTEASADTTGASGSDATNATEATDSTVGMSSSPTGGADGSASSEPTTGGSASDSASGSAGGTTGESDTATDTGPDLMGLCEAFCDKNAECNMVDPDGCAGSCAEELEDQESMCVEATTSMMTCMLAMTCEQFVGYTDNDDPGPCAAEAMALEDSCSDEACTGGIGTNEDGTECSYVVECPNSPPEEIRCDEQACTCLVDDEVVGMCPAMEVCMDLEQLTALAGECCGF